MVTKTEISSRTSDYEIFCHFLGGRTLQSGEKFLSPFRQENIPSFNIYQTTDGGWRFKDYGGDGEQGDCFDFVMKKFNLSFREALEKINEEMNLGLFSSDGSNTIIGVTIITGPDFKLHTQPFTAGELLYWESFGIISDILARFGVLSVRVKEGLTTKDRKPYKIHSRCDNPIFAYPYGNTCIKIYQPKAEKKFRFHYLDGKLRDPNFIFGMTQVENSEKVVVWTGGEKDVMTLAALGINAITGTSETGKIPKMKIEYLINKGHEVVILFDNDKTGLEKSEQFSKEYGIKRAVLPPMSNGKDISDYVKLGLPKGKIFEIINDAQIIVSDFKVVDSQNRNVEIVSDENGNIEIVVLADSEFTYDIWIFGYNREGKPIIKGLYRHGVMLLLKSAGFFKLRRENNTFIFIREDNNIIENIEVFIMTNWLQNYIGKSLKEGIDFVHRGNNIKVPPEKLLEVFLRQSHTIFNKTFMTQLSDHEKPILKDDKNCMFFFFKNKVVKVTKTGLEFLGYSRIVGFCIWRSRIIDRDFEYEAENNKCHFAVFITNVSNNEDDRKAAFHSAIGYLLHNYNYPTSGQAIVANDEEITDTRNPQGGTGKGVFSNAIKQMRAVVKIDGKKFNPEDKFKFQNIDESTQVVWLDDGKTDLKLDAFYSCLTDGWIVEKKHQDQTIINAQDSPKLLICINTALSNGGSSNKRRMFTIEFSNHYSKNIKKGIEEPIKDEHGCIFFDKEDWDQKEWNKFYSFMLDCTSTYLKIGLQHYEHRTLDHNRLRQKTSEEFYDWVHSKNFLFNVEYETYEYFKEFRNLYYGDDSEFKQRGFTNWLVFFAESKKWGHKFKRSNSVAKFIFLDQAARRFVPVF